MRRWQYKVVQQKVLVGMGGTEAEEDRTRQETLDRYGQDGWEMVSVSIQTYRRDYDPTSLQGYSFFTYFFKREAP
jgi:Domain of unknown function (DUF4177)